MKTVKPLTAVVGRKVLTTKAVLKKIGSKTRHIVVVSTITVLMFRPTVEEVTPIGIILGTIIVTTMPHGLTIVGKIQVVSIMETASEIITTMKLVKAVTIVEVEKVTPAVSITTTYMGIVEAI